MVLELKKDSVFIDKILQYEQKIFNEFIQKRTNLIKNIKDLDLSILNKQQQHHFINDLKDIIDPIKMVNENIENYFLNSSNSFKNSNSTNEHTFILFYLFLKDTFFLSDPSSDSSDSSETKETSESDSDSDSSSDSSSSESE